MKNSLLLIFAVFIAFAGRSQYNSKGDTPSMFRPGFMWYYTGIRPAKVEKVRKYDRLIFDITYNDWNGDQQPFQNHWASIGFNTNLMFDVPLTKGNTVALGVGVSHQLTRVRHDALFAKSDNPPSTNLVPKGLQTFNKNVLVGNAFSIPLELRFRKASWKHMKLHLGGKVGYQANMFSKTIFGSGSNRDVVKDYGFSDLNRLIYSAHVRFGFRAWAIYASYNLNKIFAESASTQLNQLQFGLSISLY